MTNHLKWLGHSAFQITSEKGKVILIDPWITGNPSCPIGREEIKSADLIMVTHDHYDHIGTDIPDLIKSTGATLIAQREVAGKLQELGVGPENTINGRGMNIGGDVDIKGINITMVQAVHSCFVGSPAGYIIKLEDGTTIYHAGDTGIFAGMGIIGELYQIDLALIPIGSIFVMNPFQAAASLTLLKPKKVVPMHYRTFPILVQNADEFIKLAKEKAPNVEVVVLEPGVEIGF